MAYANAHFSKDGKAFVTTDKDSSFSGWRTLTWRQRNLKIVTPDLSWDVDEFQQSGRQVDRVFEQ